MTLTSAPGAVQVFLASNCLFILAAVGLACVWVGFIGLLKSKP